MMSNFDYGVPSIDNHILIDRGKYERICEHLAELEAENSRFLEGYMKPTTYWERRCLMNEKVLDNVINILGLHLPHTQDALYVLGEGWQNSIESLDAEFASPTPPPTADEG